MKQFKFYKNIKLNEKNTDYKYENLSGSLTKQKEELLYKKLEKSSKEFNKWFNDMFESKNS